VSDELRRRFRDKIHGRPAARQRRGSPAPADIAVTGTLPTDGPAENAAPTEPFEDETPSDSIRIQGIEHGPFPSASPLNPRFQPGMPRIRLILDIGASLRRHRQSLSTREREVLLAFCPHLPDHRCAGGQDIYDLLLPGDAAASGAEEVNPEADGLALAHLIEHVAIELLVSVSRSGRCSGVTCAYRGRKDRFDIFLECSDPLLGRAMAMLAAAFVRDLCSGNDRLGAHLRTRDLLGLLRASDRPTVVPEDIAIRLGWRLGEAREALEALARLGYLDPIAAPFTFSSATGMVFRRAASGAFAVPAGS
jgi:hypothetical protein